MHTEEEQVVHEGTTLLSNPEIFHPTSNPAHIEFDLTEASARTRTKFNTQVNKHLQVRGYTNLRNIQEDRPMNAEERRNFPKDRLALRRKILQVRTALRNEEVAMSKKRCIKISQLVICILHLENRTSESVITQFVKVALDSVQDRADMKKTIETYMNTTVFGKTESAGQWTIALDLQGQPEKISLSNRQSRDVSDHLMEIASTCLANLELGRLADWIKALEFFNAFMSMLRARYEFDPERILKFQDCVDKFMDLWHKLTG